MILGLCSLAVLTGIATPAEARARFVVDLEVGPAWQSRNDVEIPNDGTATRFSLVDLVGSGPGLAARLHLDWNIDARHGLRATLAPFATTEVGTFATPVRFRDGTFAARVPTEATYRFDSYRLGYRHVFLRGESWEGTWGLTAKIRAAAIELRQGTTVATETNVGFVPLLHLAALWRPGQRWEVFADLEGLAGGPGRALDFELGVACNASAAWGFSLGYRSLEGGADVTEVYNFAWLHAVVAGATYRWR